MPDECKGQIERQQLCQIDASVWEVEFLSLWQKEREYIHIECQNVCRIFLPDTTPEYMPERMPDRMRQIECQSIFQIECQKIFQIECQYIYIYIIARWTLSWKKYMSDSSQDRSRTICHSMSQHMSDFTTGKMSERMPTRTSEQSPEHFQAVSEHKPDLMPEHASEHCVNLHVRLSRTSLAILSMHVPCLLPNRL